MNKKDFFIKALKNKAYTKLRFIIKCFTQFEENDNTTKPFDLIKKDNKYFFYDPEVSNYIEIIDADTNAPLFSMSEELAISSDDIINLDSAIKTSYGNLLFNYIALVQVFGKDIPYQNKHIKIPNLEKLIFSKLEDKKYNSSEFAKMYVNFARSIYYLTGISLICSQGHTEKTLLPPTGIEEYRKQLLEEYKDRLDDPSIIAKIDELLIDFDSNYLKGDPGEDFLISKKSRKTVRRKLFLMAGAESGLDDNNVKVKLVSSSLSEGWDIDNLPAMYNTVRAGSYNRGAETVFGGVVMKLIFRAFSNTNISEEDCGTTLGEPIILNEKNRNTLDGFTVLYDNKNITVDKNIDLSQYMGKKLLLRSFTYCKTKNGDYCKVCAGNLLSINPTGLAVAVNESFGSEMLSIFMSGAHAKNLEIAKLNVKTMLK